MGIILTGDLAYLLDLLDEVNLPEFDDEEYEGWYCVQHNPVTCGGCGQPVCFIEPPTLHLIVVWEEKDDADMLRIAARLQKIDYEPIIVKYYPLLGPCIPYEEVKKHKS